MQLKYPLYMNSFEIIESKTRTKGYWIFAIGRLSLSYKSDVSVD